MKLYRFLTLAVLTFACACSSEITQTKKESIQTNQSIEKSENNETTILTEPVKLSGMQWGNEMPENIRNVWKEFTADGQYRLAQKSDMNVPGQDKTFIPPYEYAWGDLNYPKRIEDDHLAAIIVDTTRNDSNKFSLVIFSPLQNKKDEYEINWLYRDLDLSKTTVNRASSELYVAQYSNDGSRKSCSVKWNLKLRKFQCN